MGCSSASGTGPSSSNPSSPEDIVRSNDVRATAVDADIPTAVDANNAFAIDLFTQAAPDAPGPNFLTSPISASLALTMTYAGAKATTASQMASVLHISSSGPSIFDAQNALTQKLDGLAAAALASDQTTAKENGGAAPSPSDYQVEVVNSIWGQEGYPWATPFLSTMAVDYGTGVYVEDFATNPSTGETAINDWVSGATSGKIDPLLAPGTLTKDTRMVLVNAIHLKLPWASAFDPSQTAPATFTRGDGSTVKTPFMNQDFANGLPYASTAEGQFVAVPLAGSELSVVLALPTKDLATLTASLTKDSFAFTSSASEVILSLPKFTFTSSTFSLAKSLQALGMTDAFNKETANFTGLCASTPDGDNLYISDVLEKATLAVAETGVEAAAATAVIVDGASVAMANPPPPVVITLDHPFLVSIVDGSGTILFLGQIGDPTDSGS